MYKIKGVYKIMEIKKVLNLLSNQYAKSFKRFENDFSFMSNFSEQVKDFNKGYLNLISAVLSGDVEQIRVSLYGSMFYINATLNEQKKLKFELLGIF